MLHEARHLDQWHSDEDDDDQNTTATAVLNRHPPAPPLPTQPIKDQDDDDDDDEDTVPLSKLKKKSICSLRDNFLTNSSHSHTTPAQTLARTREELQKNSAAPLFSQSTSSSDLVHNNQRRTSVASSRSLVEHRASRLINHHS
jgi:hypothetical protein